MSLLHARDLSLRYGPKVLLDAASFTIGHRDRVGLIGPNGTGKSSLMRILSGRSEADSGEVQLTRRAVAGYLPQEIAALPQGSLIDGVLGSVPGRSHLEARIAATDAALASTHDAQDQLELAEDLAELHEELQHHEERYGRHRAEEILMGLGFLPAQLEEPAAVLSGGWRMRAALAGLLLQDPELLLLDEPTNHLDVPTLEWFDSFLRRSRKALVLVSHDREFLDRQIDRVLSFEVEGLRTYAGNYERYLELRAAELERLEAQAERQERRRAELQAFIDRFRAKATKARQVQSRIKLLEKEEIVERRDERATVRFRFPDAPRAGREVARIDNLSKSYGEKIVYRNLSGQVLRGDRVAVIGLNGAGKTTLLKLLAGEVAPDAGQIALGHNVELGYFAQHHTEKLNAGRTVLDEIWSLVPDQPQSWVRSVLGAFLFSGDDVDKRIGVLSGGERARVALARLLVVPSNFLLMDEPTNHLDLDSSEALIEALQGYQGTLLFVSHNRSFVNGLATQVWEVKDGQIDAQPGNLDDWSARRAQLAEERLERKPTADGRKPSSRQERAKERERRAAVLKPLQAKVAATEARVAELEARKKELEATLADAAVFADSARSTPLVRSHREVMAELEVLYARWEEEQSQLAEAEAEIA
jgi:ATP-binding cassette subfamily F protein 3